MSKLAAFQFYPGDWLKDPALSICSPGARGVWMDVLCLMFESPKRGFLITNHQPWTLEQISEALRGHASANLLFLKELVRNGVMKHDKRRGYFSARLVQDERNRETWRAEKRRQVIKNKGSDSGHHSTKLPAVLHSSSSSSDLKTLPNPLTTKSASREGSGFEDVVLDIFGEFVHVKKPKNRRLWTTAEKDGMHGQRAADYVRFFQSKGFEAEIFTPQ